MIGYLKGNVIATYGQEVWIDVNGVGYRVKTGRQEVREIGNGVELFIHTAVREDAITLYGFQTLDELQLFEMLITVSGVGPKTGMAILSTNTPNQIETAISQADIPFFTRVPGIGKKSAQRIIIDLKNKVGQLKELDLSQDEENDTVFMALTSFGFKPNEIKIAMNEIDRSLTEPQQIKEGLKRLGKGVHIN